MVDGARGSMTDQSSKAWLPSTLSEPNVFLCLEIARTKSALSQPPSQEAKGRTQE